MPKRACLISIIYVFFGWSYAQEPGWVKTDHSWEFVTVLDSSSWPQFNAVDQSGRIWIGDYNDNLRVVDPDGNLVAQVDSIHVPVSAGGDTVIPASPNRGMSVAASGNILFALWGSLVEIDVNSVTPTPGTVTAEAVHYLPLVDEYGNGYAPMGPAVDAEGYIYVGRVVGTSPIAVIDPTTFDVVHTITLAGAPMYARGLAVSGDALTLIPGDLSTGGPLRIWTTTDFINYTCTDSVFEDADGNQIFVDQRVCLHWHPDGTLWVSVDDYDQYTDSTHNNLTVLDFESRTYYTINMPGHDDPFHPDYGKGPRGVAFSADGAYAYVICPDAAKCYVYRNLYPGRPYITVSPDTLDFGTAYIGFPDTLAVTVRNLGGSSLGVTDIGISGAGFSVVTDTFSLGTRESKLIEVVLEATAVAAYTGTLTITSNDPDRPMITVPLEGAGLYPPDITVAPDSFSVALYTGGLYTDSLVIDNFAGTSDLHWEISLENVGDKTITFTKENWADWTDPANQDQITDSVAITRANMRGIFNAVTETVHDRYVSPEGTEWAFGLSGEVHPQDYQCWNCTHGNNPPSVIGEQMSMHLIREDIYLDVVFHSWTMGGDGGGFSYTRTDLGPRWLEVTQEAGVLPPGSDLVIGVTIDANRLEGGDYRANIVIGSNDPDEGLVTIPVHLVVTGAPNLFTEVDTLDFGQVFVNHPRTLELVVENTGTADLLIPSILLEPAEYTIEPTFAGIDPGDIEIFEVTFAPTVLGDHPGTLTFSSNDPDSAAYVVTLMAESVTPPVIAVAPDSLDEALFTGGTSSQILRIDNTAGANGSDLVFDISVREAQNPPALSVRVLSSDWKDGDDVRRPSLSSGILSPETAGELANAAAAALVGVSRTGTRTVAGETWETFTESELDLFRTQLRDYQVRVDQYIRINGVDLPRIAVVGSGTYDMLLYLLMDSSLVSQYTFSDVWYYDTYADIEEYDGLIICEYDVDITNLEALSIKTFYEAGKPIILGMDDLDDNFYYYPGTDSLLLPVFGISAAHDGDFAWGSLNPNNPITEGITYIYYFGSDNDWYVLDGADWIFAGMDGNYYGVSYSGRARTVLMGEYLAGIWGNGNDGLVRNAIEWALAYVSWLAVAPESGAIPAGSYLDVEVSFDASGLFGGDYQAELTVSSNDPVTPEDRIPVHLNVTGAPDIGVSLAEYDSTSTIFFSTYDATTVHSFVTPFPSAGDGLLTVTVAGDFNGSSEYADIYIEGDLIGTINPIFHEPTSQSFEITEPDLNAYLADGSLVVTVDNSVGVGVIGQDFHAVRLTYGGAMDTLDFQVVFVGYGATLVVGIENNGTDVLEVSSISVDNEAFGVSRTAMTLGYDEADTLSVWFRPTAVGSYLGTLTMVSNDPDSGTYQVVLAGEGLEPPILTLSPEALESALNSNELDTLAFTIGNTGASDLVWQVMPAFAAGTSVSATSPVFTSRPVRDEAKYQPVQPDRRPPSGDIYTFGESARSEIFSGKKAKLWRKSRDRAKSKAGGSQVRTSLETVLENLNANYTLVSAAIPNRYDFSEGEWGNYISDGGGDDMYDGGNMLYTNLGGPLEYSNDIIIPSPVLGAGGRYFTRKYPGLFVMAADIEGVSEFVIDGYLGADGGGSADGAVLQVDVVDRTFYGFVKRVYDAYDPSVNHLVIVEDAAASHEFSTYTDYDYHRVFNLSQANRLYYLL
ncbi:MAG: choice-of-anchor D domain-containing protein, partial [Fidelibacterota bacterium]